MNFENDRKIARLLVQAQEGDRSAYEDFLLQVSLILRAYLLRRVSNAEDLEDILQDSLLTIHRSRHAYRPERPVGPWLYAICEHRMIDFYRRHRRIKRREVLCCNEELDERLSPEIRETDPRGQVVREALANLPAKQKKIIELLKFQDLSVNEVAAQMQMNASAVKVTAFRGYQAIRKFFGGKAK